LPGRPPDGLLPGGRPEAGRRVVRRKCDLRAEGAAAERASTVAMIAAWLRNHPNLSAIMREHIAGQIERGEYAQVDLARRDGGE